MNKAKKVFLRVMPVVLVLMVVSTSVFGFGSFEVNSMKNISGQNISSANNAVQRIWGTVVLILQILAVAAIVVSGVRYMFASADAKADIKKQSIGLVVGAILVFGATTIINFIVTVTSDITK